MSSVTVRLDEDSRELLREISERSGESMQAVLKRAIENYRRRVFLESVNAAYGRLQLNPTAIRNLAEERQIWEATLGDGLEIRPRSRQRKKGHGRRLAR